MSFKINNAQFLGPQHFLSLEIPPKQRVKIKKQNKTSAREEIYQILIESIVIESRLKKIKKQHNLT